MSHALYLLLIHHLNFCDAISPSGKTELAKALAEYLFQDASSMVTIDSESFCILHLSFVCLSVCVGVFICSSNLRMQS